MAAYARALFHVVLFLSLAFGVFFLWYFSWGEHPTFLFGDSMPPTLQSFDAVVVRGAATVQRGDLVLYRYGTGRMVHRILALPGETVRIQRGEVVISSKAGPFPLAEPYVQRPYQEWDYGPLTLGPAEYLMLGDNRGSPSGRTPHMVRAEDILGVVERIVFPPWRAGPVR